MSGVRSLNRVEAAERSALLGVKSYHVEVDLTVLPVGPEVRCTSTVRFVCRQEGARDVRGLLRAGCLGNA